MESPHFSLGFQSQFDEYDNRPLRVEGKFPDWLNGALLRTGPAMFELEHQNYNHWFDGLAKLYKFSFQDGAVYFSSQFIKSNSYLKAKENGKVSIKEFATDPCRNIFQKAMSLVRAPALTDNGNINIINYEDVLLATSETPIPIVFDPETLETLHQVGYEDDLQGQIEPAHPQYDYDGYIYNYLLKYSLHSKYYVFRMKGPTRKREVIATVDAPNPSYMHSMGMTDNYIILTEFPKIVKPLEMKFGDKPLIENYHWKPELGTKYQVIDKRDGSVSTYEGEACFGFHHVNAYEEQGHIIMDFVAYEDASVLEQFYLKDLRSNDPTYAAGYLTRVSINPKRKHDIQLQRLSDKLTELPRINDGQYRQRKYRYSYGAGNTVEGNFLDDITKIDAETGAHWSWFKEGHFPGEPVFVSRPDPQSEDDGLLLSVVLDAEERQTYLLVMDATNLEEIGRATAEDMLIPFNFHGQYL